MTLLLIISLHNVRVFEYLEYVLSTSGAWMHYSLVSNADDQKFLGLEKTLTVQIPMIQG